MMIFKTQLYTLGFDSILLSIIKMSSKTNYKVYMDVQIGATAAGRVIFELFNDLTSKTA